MSAGERLLIVGNPDPIHLGAHLLRATRRLGVPAELCNTNAAFAAPWLMVKYSWRLRGHRPPRLETFGREVLARCQSFRPTWLLATGMAPLDAQTLEAIGKLGILRLNYLTDDPWNPSHRAPWFNAALRHYDYVFSPRQSNLFDLRDAGCQRVAYLPFAYDPTLHFPEPPLTEADQTRFAADVVFAGGADPDRVPYLAALIAAGFRVVLYGGYWKRFAATRSSAHGHADMAMLRKAVGGAKVALCLVRRANRDGHVMRSFEVPAMGGCMLAEDTDEHRAILGSDGAAVIYFRTIEEMVLRLRWLLDHDDERQRLAAAGHKRIVEGHNTYQDRLMAMLTLANSIGEGAIITTAQAVGLQRSGR